MSFFGGITNIFTGGGALGSIVRTVAMGYIVNKLSNSANKENETGSRGGEQKTAPGIDNGVRLQVKPAADEKIPVLYGSAFFGGIISEAVMSNNNQRMHYVLTLAEKTGTLYSNSSATSYSFGSIYWDDQTVTFKADGVTIDYTTDRSGNRDASLDGLVKIYCYAGGSASANQRFPTGTSGTAVNAYSVVNGWTSAHAMSNLIFAVVEVNYSAERNIKGIGDVKFQVTSSMNKPGDVIYDYATNNLYGANIANTEIDTTTITALNTYSANSVSYIDELSAPQTLTNRYQINGLVNTDNPVMQNVEELTSSAGSWLSYSLVTGKWSVIINRAGTSIASFDDTNILGTVSVSGTGLQDLYNSVKTEFPNRDIRDGTDYVQLSIAAGDRNANEPNNTLNISYNFLNEPVQAQLLGFIELKQSRIDLVITFQSDYTTLNLVPGDIIDVTNSVLGFTNKLFRIITIAEVEGDSGLQSEITALEYDSTVYNEDLSRVTRTVTNGFTTTGNIGRPGTPTIVKFEDDARPRIEVSTTSPTGTVEGIEYWLSNDVALGEAQRNYRLIGTRQPNEGNANVRGTFTAGDTITLDYDNIGTSNLVMKTRGYNSTTVGPFSSNSAITTFTSTQTTDAIGPETAAYDELGGLMTALSVVSLLNKLDGLFGNSATGSGGVFQAIKDILFPNDTTGSTNAETILTSSNTFQSNINDSINSAIQDPAFLSNVSQFTSNLSAYSIDGLADVSTANFTKVTNRSVLAWNGTEWRPALTCCPSDFSFGGNTVTPPTPPTPLRFLNRYYTWPNDITNTFTEEVTGPGNVVVNAPTLFGQTIHGEFAPQTGSYYAWFTGNSISQGGKIYNNLTIGTGSVKLYKSDGTLAQTLSAGSLILDKNRIEFPFADRELGTNYYILMDANVVYYCPDAPVGSPAITSSTEWNFNTPYFAVDAYSNVTPGSLDTLTSPNAPANPQLTVTSISWGSNTCPNANLVVSFSESITLNSGTVTITNVGTGSVVATLAGGTATISSNQMNFGVVSAMTYGNVFYVNVSAGIARTIRSDATTYACGVWANTAATQSNNLVFNGSSSTPPALALISYSLTEQDLTGNVITSNPFTSTSIESLLTLTFNRPIYRTGSGTLNISIYEADGTLHQAFNLNSAFNGSSDFTSEIVSMSDGGTTIRLNPTRDFKTDTSYYCLIPNNVLKDICGTNFVGVSDTSVITWTTVGWNVSTTFPVTNATNTTVNNSGLNLTFPQNIQPGTGRLKIFNSANVLIANISSTNGNVIYS
jgi:hypothetical protein